MWCSTDTLDTLSFIWDILREADFVKGLLCIIILALSIVYLLKNTYDDLPPGPYGYPFVGNLKILKVKPHIHLTNLKDKYGDVYCLKLGKHKSVVVCSLNGINEGMVTDPGKFIGRPDVFSAHVLFNGDRNGGICFSDADLKYNMKKDFVLKSVDNLCCNSGTLADVISGEVEGLVDFMLSQKKGCDAKFVIESTMLRLMMYVVNGKLYEPNDENFMEIWKTFEMREALYSTDNWSMFVPLLNQLHRHNSLDVWERIRLQFEYQRNIVNRHKDEFNPKIINDMIDQMLVMLEGNEDMGLLDQDDLDLLFVEMSGAGYKALSTTLLWLLLYMASFPDVQRKVQEELETVIGKERLPKLSDQPYLPYTCAVVMETHRLATVMPFLYPHRAVEKTQFMGYTIPENTIMLFNIWSLHHDPRYWKHPMKFDPSRFLTPSGTLHIPDHFLPFGDGIRCCPGESLAEIQLFLFATHILHQMNLTLTKEVDLEGVYKGYLLSPKSFQLNVTPRFPGECIELGTLSISSEDIQNDTVVSVIEEADLSIKSYDPGHSLSLLG